VLSLQFYCRCCHRKDYD